MYAEDCAATASAKALAAEEDNALSAADLADASESILPCNTVSAAALEEASVLMLPCNVESAAWKAAVKSDDKLSLATAAEEDKAVTLPSIAVALALDEVTNPANAASFSVSTELINDTISANESLSASDANKIASTLPFSVVILPSKEDSIAKRCVCADELKAVSAAMYAEDCAAATPAKAAAADADKAESAAV